MKAAFNAFMQFFTTLANGCNHLATAFSLICEYFSNAARLNLDESIIEAQAALAKATADNKVTAAPVVAPLAL